MTNEPTVRSPAGYAQEVFWVGPQGGLVGLSADAKPTARPDGTALRPGLSFYETDTRRTYLFDGSAWREQPPADWPTAAGPGDGLTRHVLEELRAIRTILATQAGLPTIFPALPEVRTSN